MRFFHRAESLLMVQARESVPPEEGSAGSQAAALKLVMALKKDLISISPLESEMNASLNHRFISKCQKCSAVKQKYRIQFLHVNMKK